MKSKPTQARMQHVVPGLALSADGRKYTVNVSEVDPGSNVFLANEFRLKRRKNDLLMLFGSTDDFDDRPARFDLAIQLEIPLVHAAGSLIESVWDKNSLTGKPLGQHMEEALGAEEIAWAQNYQCPIALPESSVRDRTFRKFPVTLALITWADMRGYIEFVEVTPTAMIGMQTGSPRKGDAIRSLLTVVMEAKVIFAFLLAVRKGVSDYQEIQRQHVEAP